MVFNTNRGQFKSFEFQFWDGAVVILSRHIVDCSKVWPLVQVLLLVLLILCSCYQWAPHPILKKSQKSNKSQNDTGEWPIASDYFGLELRIWPKLNINNQLKKFVFINLWKMTGASACFVRMIFDWIDVSKSRSHHVDRSIYSTIYNCELIFHNNGRKTYDTSTEIGSCAYVWACMELLSQKGLTFNSLDGSALIELCATCGSVSKIFYYVAHSLVFFLAMLTLLVLDCAVFIS